MALCISSTVALFIFFAHLPTGIFVDSSRYNSCNIQFTHLKHTIQWFLVYPQLYNYHPILELLHPARAVTRLLTPNTPMRELLVLADVHPGGWGQGQASGLFLLLGHYD